MQPDSVFEMRRPYDLPAFLEQEDRLYNLVDLHSNIVARKAALDEQIEVLQSIGDVKSWLNTANPDCISAWMDIEQFDFYTSVATDGSWRKGITYVEYKFIVIAFLWVCLNTFLLFF